ncbi:hypothetical protein PAMA_008668 [Pampus argenteus]
MKGRAWLFVSQCWLAVNKGDGQLPLELGMVDVSAVSVTTGVLSVVAVLPAATLISFLFRLREGTSWLSMSAKNLENKDANQKSVIQTDVVIRKEDTLAVESSMGPLLQKSNKVDQGPQRKEVDSVSENSRFDGNQKDHMSSMKQKDPSDGSFKDDGLHRAAWSKHSSGSYVIDKLRGRRILTLAVTVSLWYRRRADFHSFSSITDCENVISIISDRQLLEARQRARYLRLVRPPTPAELRRTRGRKRRETLIYKTLRSDAAFRLKLLRSSGWLGRQTLALKVQFTLYSPALNLFSSVTLLAEQSPTGALLPSAKVQSARVYHTPVVWDYVVMVCQVILLTVTIVYYVHYIYHSVVIMEVAELLQRHNHRGHVDVSLLATWEQYIRALRGILLFLLTTKCVVVLRVNRTVATSAKLFTRSLPSLVWLTTLLCHYRGLRAVRGLILSGHDFLYYRALYLSCTVVWTAVMIGVVSSLVRDAKRSQSRSDVLTIRELASYIKWRVSEFTGLRRPTQTDNNVERRTFYLEEFESLVDELLFRLNTLSNSLHHTLPPKAHRYREDSPTMSLIQEPSNMDSQSFVRTLMTEQTMVNDLTDVSDHGGAPPTPRLLRSQLELKILQLLAHRGQRTDTPSPNNTVASGNPQQCGARAEEHRKTTELQNYFKGQTCPSLPESAPPTAIQSGQPVSQSVLCDVLETQSSQWTKTSDICWFSNSGKRRTEGPSATQATHSEVVVEVLVHDEPGSVEPDKQ